MDKTYTGISLKCGLRPPVVLCRGRIGTYFYMVNGPVALLFVPHIMAGATWLWKEERQPIITWRRDGQSIRIRWRAFSVHAQVQSRKPSNTWWKLALMSSSPWEEFQVHLNARLRNHKFTAAQIRASSRNVATSLHGQIATKKPLLTKSKKKKRGAWNRKEWTLDQWKSVLWSDESKFEIFSIFFFERMPRVCKTVKAKGGYFENIKHILVCLTILV